ncbi:hypothetical protein F4781DRAFT_380036 [Annulohypoxylon bovei var. microspora]|nr:hypothetical protein F4781DRAFT_380036 [Annulohypoxylon bovei var. microspora]
MIPRDKMPLESYWWDMPAIVGRDSLLRRASRTRLKRLVNYKTRDYDNDANDACEVISVDFDTDDPTKLIPGVHSDIKPPILLMRASPKDWDRPAFEKYLLGEWMDSNGPDKPCLVLLPAPASAGMEIEEFWATEILPHCLNKEDKVSKNDKADEDENKSVQVLTRHGWVDLEVRSIDDWMDSIDVDYPETWEEGGDAVAKYQSEPSVPGTQFLTDWLL